MHGRVDLAGTAWEGRTLGRFRRERGDRRWVTVASDGLVLGASCDPSSLGVVVEFRRFVGGLQA